MGIMLIRWCGKVERQSKSGVVKIGMRGAIAKSRSDAGRFKLQLYYYVYWCEWNRVEAIICGVRVGNN